MRYLWLVWAGLARDPLRVALTTGSVAVAFVLLWLLRGVDSGIAHRIDSVPADLLHVTGRGWPGYLPVASLHALEDVPGVAHVASLAYHNSRYRDFKGGVHLVAVDLERFLPVAYDVRMDSETVQAFLATPGAAIVGAGAVERFGWQRGDRLRLRPIGVGPEEWSFEMVGTWDYKGVSLQESVGLFVDYAHIDQTLPEEEAGRVAAFVVRVHDANRANAVGAAIDERFRNSSSPTLTATTRDTWMSGRHPGQVRLAANAIVGASFFAILFCTGGVMAQSVRDRYGELAMMKSLGFGSGVLLCGIAGESVAVCLAGAAMALVPAALVDAGELLGQYGAVVYPPRASLYAFGFVVALLLAVVSVALPGWRVLRLSPSEVGR